MFVNNPPVQGCKETCKVSNEFDSAPEDHITAHDSVYSLAHALHASTQEKNRRINRA